MQVTVANAGLPHLSYLHHGLAIATRLAKALPALGIDLKIDRGGIDDGARKKQ